MWSVLPDGARRSTGLRARFLPALDLQNFQNLGTSPSRFVSAAAFLLG